MTTRTLDGWGGPLDARCDGCVGGPDSDGERVAGLVGGLGRAVRVGVGWDGSDAGAVAEGACDAEGAVAPEQPVMAATLTSASAVRPCRMPIAVTVRLRLRLVHIG
jgi:hypothetical protein